MSSIVPSAHVAGGTCTGKQKEISHYERQNTRASLTTPNQSVTDRKTPNPRIHLE